MNEHMTTYADLADKGFVVTGAAGGIGSAVVRQLVSQGAKVLCLDRDAASLARLTDALGAKARGMVIDVTDPAQVGEAAQTALGAFGNLRGWINNVGYFSEVRTLDLGLDEWRKAIALNLDSAFIGSQAAARVMIPNGGGSIINVSSNAGIRTSPRNAHYSAAKAGVAHLTRCLAAEWGKDGVRVNAVIPGYTNTSMIEWLTGNPEKLAKVEKAIPLRRIGQPDDVANAMLWLCSQASAYVTGVVLCADGGLQIG